jgi:hypothetical protein
MTTIADAELAARLSAHLSTPEYLKGWEVEKRTCIGAARGKLRASAREVKGLFRQAGPRSRTWTSAVERLLHCLAGAGECDFDGLLAEALEALTSSTTQNDAACSPQSLAVVEKHLKADLKAGRRTRDYTAAEVAAEDVRTARAAWSASLEDAMRKRAAYAAATDALRSELEAIGENDFDGLLRQAIGTLKKNAHAEPLHVKHPPPSPSKTMPEATAEKRTALAEPPTSLPARDTDMGTASLLELSQTVSPPALSPIAAPVPPSPTASPERKKKKRGVPPRSFLADEDEPHELAHAAETVPGSDTGAAATSPLLSPTDDVLLRASKGPPAQNTSGLHIPPLAVSHIDDGCVWLGTLPPPVQAALLREAFPPGAKGVCGGLATERNAGASVRGAHGALYEPKGVSTVSWTELGLHGNHLVEHAHGDACAAVLAAVRGVAAQLPSAARARLDAFVPDAVRIGFESMGERSIGKGGSLCGWSADHQRADKADGGLKLVVLLGSAKGVTDSFKFSRQDSDADALHVPLAPGDMLLLYDSGRSWVSAVTGFERGVEPSPALPFDFAHLSLVDLRRLRAAKTGPAQMRLLSQPTLPTPKDAGWKWMQCTYTVVHCAHYAAATPTIELVGH